MPTMRKLILLWVVIIGSLLDLGATAVEFYKGELTEAKQKAIRENKLFFVDFYANWCMPCKWMDQTTFNDPAVAAIMNQDFVAVKVNIEAFDGMELSQKYQIKVLPTILIFNADGIMIERIEETLAPSKMIAMLNTHRTNKGATIVTHKANASPVRAKSTNSHQPAEEIERPAQVKQSYRLQMGVFSQYEYAAAHVTKLQDQFLEPIVVVNEVVDRRVIFKIMMGHFQTKNEADSYKRILKEKFGLDSMVI